MNNDSAYQIYRAKRISHWDKVAPHVRSWFKLNRLYHSRLARVYSFLIPPGSRVLEVGCGRGDLLSSVKAGYGVGIDFSPRMLERARKRYPQFRFIQADAHEFDLNETFDFVILSDLLNDLWDVQTVLDRVATVCRADTRVILNNYSLLWEAPLSIAQTVGAANKRLRQNWLSPEDTANILRLSGFEVIQRRREFICPLPIPFVAKICNTVLVRFRPFCHLALANFYVTALRDTVGHRQKRAPKVSVVVPSRNEAGNIAQLFERIPEMGSGTEILFVEGGSTDTTYPEIERCLKRYSRRNAVLLRQEGMGKGAAVRTGFAAASGDILMILDADMTVAPEDLPRFYDAVVHNRGEFINGVRLVYPMEHRAMRFFNYLGNKFFSLAFSKLLGQPVKDTLCGTKVLWKKDYERIARNRRYFGEFDPFGDFDLLLGAAKLNLKIVDMPVRYRERTYGETNIQRWHHGSILFKMLTFAARKMLFV